MIESRDEIKKLIKFLNDVFKKRIRAEQAPVYLKKNKLKDLLDDYYISFKDKDELKKEVAYNYNLIKDFSFPDSKEGSFNKVKSVSDYIAFCNKKDAIVGYAEFLHAFLIESFKENLSQYLPNLYPFKSNEVKEKFIEYYHEYVNNDDWFVEISFIKKKMEAENLIMQITDNKFMEILYKEKLLNDIQFKIYLEKEKLSSLNKTNTAKRSQFFKKNFHE